MTALTRVENMTAQELKDSRSELIEDLTSFGNVTELAQRYVQARLDAKMRDEKMAEQGKQITDLNEEVSKREKLLNDWGSQLNQLRSLRGDLEAERDSLIDQLGDTNCRLTELDVENLRLKRRIAELEAVVSDYETELRIGYDEPTE